MALITFTLSSVPDRLIEQSIRNEMKVHYLPRRQNVSINSAWHPKRVEQFGSSVASMRL